MWGENWGEMVWSAADVTAPLQAQIPLPIVAVAILGLVLSVIVVRGR